MDMAARLAQLGGWSIELPGLQVRWSDEVAAIHRVPPGYQPSLDGGLDFYLPEHRPLIAEAVRRCMQDGTPWDLELQLQTFDGQRRWVRSIGVAARDAGGRIVRVEGAFKDIDQRKRIELQLRESEDRLQRALRGASEGVWELDLVTGHHYMSPRWKALLGYGPDDLAPVRQEWLSRVHPDDLPRQQAAALAHFEGGAPYALDYRLRTRSGAYRWFRVRGQVERDERGEPHRFAGTMTDIDEQHEAEQARRRLDERLGLATAAANIGIWEIEADTRQAIWDERTFALYGRSAAEGLSPDEVFNTAVARDERQRAYAWFGALFDRQEVPPIELALHWPDGTPHWIAAKGRLTQSGLDPRPRLLGVNWDITAQRLAQAALLASRAELSALALRLTEQEKLTTRRLSQSLHDQLGQTLSTMRLALDTAWQVPRQVLAPRAVEPLARVDALVDEAIAQVRRTIVELRPVLLDELGLAAAIEHELRTVPRPNAGIDLRLEAEPDSAARRWPPEVEYAAYMVLREALGNAVRHAGASLVRVRVSGGPATLVVQVLDDGHGRGGAIEPRPGHLGLIGMRERALAIGADFAVDSAPEGGTHVTLRWQAPA